MFIPIIVPFGHGGMPLWMGEILAIMFVIIGLYLMYDINPELTLLVMPPMLFGFALMYIYLMQTKVTTKHTRC